MTKSNRPMGLGRIGERTITFARKFRWTVAGKYLTEHFNKKFSYSLSSKQIELEIYDVWDDGKDPGLTWLVGLGTGKYPDEQLTFTTYDGCGTALYQVVFGGISLLVHNSGFDYASSEESSFKVTLGFETADVEVFAPPAPPAPKGIFIKSSSGHHIEMNDIEMNDDVSNIPPAFKAALEQTKNLKHVNDVILDLKRSKGGQMEEVEINFLNGSMRLPGKNCGKRA